MASFTCHVLCGTKRLRLERMVRRHRHQVTPPGKSRRGTRLNALLAAEDGAAHFVLKTTNRFRPLIVRTRSESWTGAHASMIIASTLSGLASSRNLSLLTV